jgi:hypothetical protein
LLKLVKENPNSHLFLDEVDISKDQISPEMLAEISKELSIDSYLWAACKSDKPPYQKNKHLHGMKYKTYQLLVLSNRFNPKLTDQNPKKKFLF